MAQPKYQLLQQWLRDQINSGEYTANQQIPTELELAEQFGYSRQTIRQAISGLEQEGLLKRTPGRGTFVCQQNAGRVNRSESRTRRVGVLTTYLDDYIFPGIINGIERVLSRHDYLFTLGLTHNKTLDEAMGTVQIYDPAGGSEMNLFSAAGWKGMDAGTPIAGRDGWYRFSEYIQVTSETQEVVRIWAYVNTIAENYLYIDNLSVKYMEPLSDSASYTLQENDPSGWTTTGTGTVAKTDGDFALTIESDGEAITTKSVNCGAGSWLLELD